MPAVAPARPAALDPRTDLFCRPAGPDVFGGVVYANQIWTPDEFDVDGIHAPAREAFGRLLNRAAADSPPPHGRTLLLLGEGGSGKTHLMRAFRHAAHEYGAAYCGYMQMSTRVDSYDRYLLTNLIDSLERPYHKGKPETGLRRLARGVLDALVDFPAADRQRLADDQTAEPRETAELVHRMAFAAVQYPRFHGIDLDVLRAVLFVLANDTRMHALALKWLRCEDLGRSDRELLDLVPRPGAEMPARTVRDLGRLMHATHRAALVLLVDQIEETITAAGGAIDGRQFREAVTSVVEAVEGLPNAVAVLGCLDDLYGQGKTFLPGSKLDRLNQEPPVRLSKQRPADEVAALVGRRLEVLFSANDVPTDPADPLAPYTTADLARLENRHVRMVLGSLHAHRQACVAAGRWVPFADTPNDLGKPKDTTLDWERKWNDFRAATKAAVSDDEVKLTELLAAAIRAVSDEMPNGVHFGTDPDGRFVQIEVHGGGNSVDKLLVAVCNRGAQNNGLKNQVAELAHRAGEIPAVLVRNTDFPKTPKSQVNLEIAKLVLPRGKGRKVVVSDSDWRAMAAFRSFREKHHADAGFADWQRTERPLCELPALSGILALEKLLEAAPVVSPPPPPPALKPPAPPPPVAVIPPRAIEPTAAARLGVTRASLPEQVTFKPADFRRHAAFLGGSGSGKTTAALTLIEHLLLAGVPAVLVDRKGDLSRYADPTAWDTSEPDPERAARRAKLRGCVDVALFTPGNATGRPLAIPVVPADLDALPPDERELTAQFAAAGIGRMLGWKGKTHDAKLVILQKSIELLAAVPGSRVTVPGLQAMVKDRDASLTAAFEGYEDKHYKKLAEELLTLAHQHRRLLDEGERLDVDALLGRGPHAVPGKTRLSVVNTQFLADDATADFWVSQFLLAVDRWRAKSPAPDGVLQAVFLFDEAERYLPAVGKPATKGPMESLLRRARSAGVGLFLATQSPGDFDYKCRDQILHWLIGRVKEPVAVNKLRPMLLARPEASAKLAGQQAGEFYLVREAGVVPVRADRNLIPTEQLPEDRILALAAGHAARVM